jgi:hypothetical protein
MPLVRRKLPRGREKEGFSASLMRQIASSPVSGRVTAVGRAVGEGEAGDIRAKLTRGRSLSCSSSWKKTRGRRGSSNDSGGLKSGRERA